MSHNIYRIICNEKENRRAVMDGIMQHAKEDGDGYSSTFTWHDKVPPLESYEEAEKFIAEHDKGWYDDHAVRFLDYSKAKKTAKIEQYEQKVAELSVAKMKYRDDHSVHTFKAQHIGCSKCGSKLNKDYIVAESCPLCRADLRSQTTIDKLKWYDEKLADYRKRIEAEKAKQKKHATVKWLIKYEFHS